MTLDYRVKRDGRIWLAFLKRPGNSRPLFCPGRTKHEAIAALLTSVGHMAAKAPARLFGPDWTEAANAKAKKGTCKHCGEPYDRGDGGFDCVCQRNGHDSDAAARAAS